MNTHSNRRFNYAGILTKRLEDRFIALGIMIEDNLVDCVDFDIIKLFVLIL